MITRAMVLCMGLGGLPAPGVAQAQSEDELVRAEDREAEQYVALSADQRAQMSLGAFRTYLERTREDDQRLYERLDPRLDELESREVAADVIFWSATGLGAVAVAVGIPLFSEYQNESLADVGIGLMVGGAATFLLGIIVQAIIRPGQGDLMALIDMLDTQLGRR